MRPLVTFFLFRIRPALVIPETIRDALFPYWVKCDSRRVACAGASRARYRPVREMCSVAPPARYIEVIVIIFFDFSHGKRTGAKQIRSAMRPTVMPTSRVIVFRRRSNWLACFPSIFSRLNESRGNRGRDTEIFTCTIDFRIPLHSTLGDSSFKRNSIGTNIEYPWKYV